MGNISDCGSCCHGRESSLRTSYRNAPEVPSIRAGGITDKYYVIGEGEKIEKLTNESEARNYRKIFSDEERTTLTKLKPFVPEFFGEEILPDGLTRKICLQNLLYGFEHGSYVRFKLGTTHQASGSMTRKRKHGYNRD